MPSLPLTDHDGDVAAVMSNRVLAVLWSGGPASGRGTLLFPAKPSGTLRERMAKEMLMSPCHLFAAPVVLFFLLPPLSCSTKGHSCTEVFFSACLQREQSRRSESKEGELKGLGKKKNLTQGLVYKGQLSV